MRQTTQYPGYGFVTKDESFEYVGNGVFGDLFKNLITSQAVHDIAVDAGKSFATTAGKKAGDALIDKVFSKKDKPIDSPTKKSITENKDILSKIYGNGLFRGRGLRRI